MRIYIEIIDLAFFIFTSISVLYLLTFAIATWRKRKEYYPTVVHNHRVVIFFPAYKEDLVIENSVRSFLLQDYPTDKYDVIVISDKMKEETNVRLASLPIKLLEVKFENSSKAKALNFAIDSLCKEQYDIAVVLDADNMVQPTFLQEINKTYSAGYKAIQAHRTAKNTNTDMAVLDALSEEINNSIFREGHIALGLSSALIGSGMAFDYQWFANNMKKVSSAGEDKEIEVLLLKQNIKITYLKDLYVFDEKIQKEDAFKHQRRRWMAAQYSSLLNMIYYVPTALWKGNINYCDKVFQMIMFPRIINIGIILLFCIVISFYDWQWAIKWWILGLLFLFALGISIPKHLYNQDLYKALKRIPTLGTIMSINLFKLRGVNKKFIHTKHEHNSK